MLNIRIKIENDEYFLKMSGHCGFDEEGKDIVCAAASILCLSLCNLLENSENKLRESAKITVKKGFSEIVFHPKMEYSKELAGAFNTIETGLRLLDENYPENVSIITQNNQSKSSDSEF